MLPCMNTFMCIRHNVIGAFCHVRSKVVGLGGKTRVVVYTARNGGNYFANNSTSHDFFSTVPTLWSVQRNKKFHHRDHTFLPNSHFCLSAFLPTAERFRLFSAKASVAVADAAEVSGTRLRQTWRKVQPHVATGLETAGRVANQTGAQLKTGFIEASEKAAQSRVGQQIKQVSGRGWTAGRWGVKGMGMPGG